MNEREPHATVPHPMQPVYLKDGQPRFKPNAIVRLLLDAGKFNMNDLAVMPFSREDREQFAQLIGYSVDGFGELDYTSEAAYDKACEEADGLRPDSQSETTDETEEDDGVEESDDEDEEDGDEMDGADERRGPVVKHGRGRSGDGPGVDIELTGSHVAVAIDAWLVAHDIVVRGSRTITVNGKLCESGRVYVYPDGFVIADGKKFSGRGD